MDASTQPLPTLPTKIIRKDFADRLDQACDASGIVPPLYKGRQSWVRAALTEQFSETVSPETVRKWFAGEAKPNERRVRFLAKLLKVEEAWLSLASGTAPSAAPRYRRPLEADLGKSRGILMLDRLRRELGGTVTIAPGVDLTEPTGEVWDAEL